MKNFISKKSLLVILSLMLILTPLYSCDQSDNNDKSAVSTQSQEEEIELEKRDMDGREIRVLCWDFGEGSRSILGYTGEIIYRDPEATFGVEFEKKRVIDTVEAEYNCSITGEFYRGTQLEMTDMIRRMVNAGSADFDMAFAGYGLFAPLVTENLFIDMNSISTLHFERPWWDQRAVQDLSIANKLFFMCGDINTYDNDGTWSMLFNKTLMTKLGMNPSEMYDYVKDDNWNFDVFTELCKSSQASYDFNGDSVQDEKDQWAFGTETYNIYVHFVAGGKKTIAKDSNDIPQLSVRTEETYNILSKVMDFYLQQDLVMTADAPPYTTKGFTNVWEDTVHKAFIEGRELFYMCGLIHVASFRQMEDEFGILPIPKMTPEQDEYYHTVSTGNMTVLVIPATVDDPEGLGVVIEAIAKYSKDYVTPEYIDVQLKYRDTRDSESAEMLDIIFATRTFDLGVAFNWGGIRAQFQTMDTNFESRFTSMIDRMQLEMELAVDMILSN